MPKSQRAPPGFGQWTSSSKAMGAHIGEQIRVLMQHIPYTLKKNQKQKTVMVLIIAFLGSFHPVHSVALFWFFVCVTSLKLKAFILSILYTHTHTNTHT